MKTKTIKLDALTPRYANRDENPNKMEPERYSGLVELVRQLGSLSGILVEDLGDGTFRIIDGHHRYWAAQEVGLKELECFVLKPDAKNEALAIAMNRLRGDLDLTQVAEAMKDIVVETGWDAPTIGVLTGFSADEVESLIDRAKTTLQDSLDDVGLGAPPEPEDTAPDKPFMLEIAFASKEDYQLCRKKLRKAAGKTKDLATGLLNVLGELKQ